MKILTNHLSTKILCATISISIFQMPTIAIAQSQSSHKRQTTSHDLAVLIYDMPEVEEMPGYSEQNIMDEMKIVGKLQILNPKQERKIKNYFKDRYVQARQGCVNGVRNEISIRFTNEFSTYDLNNLAIFSQSPSGSRVFTNLRNSAYGNSGDTLENFETSVARQLPNAGLGQRFMAFYIKLMSNENHWLRASCNEGQKATLARWTEGLKAMKLRGLSQDPEAMNSGPSGNPEVDDSRYQTASALFNANKFAESFPILRLLSLEGSKSAKLLLASLYYKGNGIQRDYDMAFQLFSEVAQEGDVEGEYNLAVLYLQGYGTTKNPTMAYKWLFRSATAGHPPSELLLAERYASGDGVERDKDKAIMWYRRAAEDGYAPAQDMLGNLYQKGVLVKQDYAEAAIWHQKAALQGNSSGEFNLGRLYENGLGVKQDYSQSYNLYMSAAQKGLPAAAFGLGVAYSFGKGIPRDKVRAAFWYLKAANQGYAAAQFNLGSCYADGSGVAKDMKKAAEWYQRAANQGNGAAQFNLGFAYGLGNGILADPIEAYKWFTLSASRPETNEPTVAIKNRDYAASQMTKEQLDRAKTLVADWKPELESSVP